MTVATENTRSLIIGKKENDIRLFGGAAEKEVWGEVFDAGSGRPRTVLSIADDLIRMIGKGKYNHIEMRPGEPDQAIALADPSFTVQKLDYYPETSWEDGCIKSLEWYKELHLNTK